jgi:hypothetical protein
MNAVVLTVWNKRNATRNYKKLVIKIRYQDMNRSKGIEKMTWLVWNLDWMIPCVSRKSLEIHWN